MLLHADQSEYLDFTSRSGFVVTIHENGVTAFPSDFGLNIPIGYITSIGVEMVFTAFMQMHLKS